MVHADVKPSNVVVADGFGVKLLDFGIARLVGEDGGRAGSAHTPGYSSPARLSGERSTPTDDVFALGVLMGNLIEGVTGVDDDLRAVAAKAAQDVREKVALVKPLLRKEVKDSRVLRFDPSDRPVISLSLSSPQRSTRELTTLAERFVEAGFTRADGKPLRDGRVSFASAAGPSRCSSVARRALSRCSAVSAGLSTRLKRGIRNTLLASSSPSTPAGHDR
mgnify:CR=1 FL=1